MAPAQNVIHHVKKGDINMLIIDRFEGDFAIIETSNGMVNVPKVDLPANCKEGDVLAVQVDEAETGKRKSKISGMLEDLFRD